MNYFFLHSLVMLKEEDGKGPCIFIIVMFTASHNQVSYSICSLISKQVCRFEDEKNEEKKTTMNVIICFSYANDTFCRNKQRYIES